jgi:cytidylate kinase
MYNNYIITIGRQVGSGGLLVGQKLAERLSFQFYDNELLKIAAKESGLSEKFFEDSDEARKFDFLGRFFSLRSPVESDVWSNKSFLSGESLFKIQSDIIKAIAEKQSAVIVGRCADYILRDHKNCINVFLTANISDRIKRVSEFNKITERDAKILIEKREKKRANYYNYYTAKQWGDSTSYDLCINTSSVGLDAAVEIIINYYLMIKER